MDHPWDEPSHEAGQLEMFDIVQEVPPVPKRKKAPPGKPVWTSIRGRGKCDHCMALYLEMEHPPVARPATWRRRTEAGDIFVCAEHHQIMRSGEDVEKARTSAERRSAKPNRYNRF